MSKYEEYKRYYDAEPTLEGKLAVAAAINDLEETIKLLAQGANPFAKPAVKAVNSMNKTNLAAFEIAIRFCNDTITLTILRNSRHIFDFSKPYILERDNLPMNGIQFVAYRSSRKVINEMKAYQHRHHGTSDLEFTGFLNQTFKFATPVEGNKFSLKQRTLGGILISTISNFYIPSNLIIVDGDKDELEQSNKFMSHWLHELSQGDNNIKNKLPSEHIIIHAEAQLKLLLQLGLDYEQKDLHTQMNLKEMLDLFTAASTDADKWNNEVRKILMPQGVEILSDGELYNGNVRYKVAISNLPKQSKIEMYVVAHYLRLQEILNKHIEENKATDKNLLAAVKQHENDIKAIRQDVNALLEAQQTAYKKAITDLANNAPHLVPFFKLLNTRFSGLIDSKTSLAFNSSSATSDLTLSNAKTATKVASSILGYSSVPGVQLIPALLGTYVNYLIRNKNSKIGNSVIELKSESDDTLATILAIAMKNIFVDLYKDVELTRTNQNKIIETLCNNLSKQLDRLHDASYAGLNLQQAIEQIVINTWNTSYKSISKLIGNGNKNTSPAKSVGSHASSASAESNQYASKNLFFSAHSDGVQKFATLKDDSSNSQHSQSSNGSKNSKRSKSSKSSKSSNSSGCCLVM